MSVPAAVRTGVLRGRFAAGFFWIVFLAASFFRSCFPIAFSQLGLAEQALAPPASGNADGRRAIRMTVPEQGGMASTMVRSE